MEPDIAKPSPLAKINYVCICCGHVKYFFELFYESNNLHKKFCAECKKITPHKRHLPTDDAVRNYQKPQQIQPL